MEKMLESKIKQSIKLLQSIPKDGPIELAYSGGKDSDVILELARMSGIPFRPIYKNTTIDPPGTIKHAIDNGVEVRNPNMTMFQIIEKHGAPTSSARFCCGYLKEYKIFDRCILGIRRSESKSRFELYREPEICRVYSKDVSVRQYFPILDWTDEDIFEFISKYGIRCHPLYYDDAGNFHVERRLGCIGCPMSKSGCLEDFKRYPKMLRQWVKAVGKWRASHPNAKSIVKFGDEYDQMYCNIFCNSYKDYTDRKTTPIYPIGIKDHLGWMIRYFGVDRFHIPKFPDGLHELDTKLFMEDFFGIKFD